MKKLILTKSQTRKIILHATGLSRYDQFGKGKPAVYKVIQHLGFVQVDTNYTVERAHHHTLAARVRNYQPNWLSELQAESRIYEFWTRDSGFMPMDEFRFSLPIHEAYRSKWKNYSSTEVNLMNQVLNRIAREGPLRAKDFDNDRVTKSSGWWDWRPSKVALERLHVAGKLLATRLKDFHKLYDLTDNIIPQDVNREMPTPEALAQHLIFRSLNSIGLASVQEIAWSGRLAKPPVKEELKKLVAVGDVCLVNIAGLKGDWYMLPANEKKKITLSGDVFILSPFDPLNVYRRRLKEIFDFDYMVECFVPEAKRKYGYFALPVLAGETFIARMDAKADRKTNTLLIHNLHFEPVKITTTILSKLGKAIMAFAKFNGCNQITLVHSNNKAWAKALVKMVR
ncbi:MAG: YcaQ family DNA glycosylase [Cytophagales bacterium]|nr:YcaQ family DNA glycosylase [Cytophagales bacterium]